MRGSAKEAGFSLIEVLVAISLFSVLSVAFFQVMMATVGGSNATESVARIAEEARLGFNRMVRDTREADEVVSASATSYSVLIDFNGNGAFEPASYEFMRYSFDPGAGTISAEALNLDGSVREQGILMSGIRQDGSVPIFGYSSNLLEHDANNDGVVDEAEMRTASGVGNGNTQLDGAELDLISTVEFSLVAASGERATAFSTDAQIRNRRYRT